MTHKCLSSTISNALRNSGLWCMINPKISLLKKVHVEALLEFVNDGWYEPNGYWNSVLWYNEIKSSPILVETEVYQPKNPVPTIKHGDEYIMS